MLSVCFYFQVHQPYRLKNFKVFDIGEKGKGKGYFKDDSDTDLNNAKVFKKVSEKCYLPANELMLKLIRKHPEFKISYSFSGVFLDQAEEYSPKVLKSFQKLVKTGNVEILSETYYHSLAFLYSKDEFIAQVERHKRKVKKLFGVTPKVFRNTELIYNNDLAKVVEEMGYKGVLAEGVDRILEWRNSNFVYNPPKLDNFKLLLKNYRLSDDIAFRFSDKSWKEHPLTIKKYLKWINETHGNGNLINLFMDYETFGEHQWEDTGIFKFMEKLPQAVLDRHDNDFVTPSEAIDRYESQGEVDIPEYISWADVERDLSAWKSNNMQEEALTKIYSLEKKVLQTNSRTLLEDWRRLLTSDHFYYMCTKWFNDGDVHKYFNPYESPYEAFISYMNAYQDLNLRIKESLERQKKKDK